jgi:hypothetical protein
MATFLFLGKDPGVASARLETPIWHVGRRVTHLDTRRGSILISEQSRMHTRIGVPNRKSWTGWHQKRQQQQLQQNDSTGLHRAAPGGGR